MPVLESAAAFLASQIERLRRVQPKRRIVFPEGDDPRVRSAAERVQREELITPILLKVSHSPSDQHARRSTRLDFERRRAKGITAV